MPSGASPPSSIRRGIHYEQEQEKRTDREGNIWKRRVDHGDCLQAGTGPARVISSAWVTHIPWTHYTHTAESKCHSILMIAGIWIRRKACMWRQTEAPMEL